MLMKKTLLSIACAFLAAAPVSVAEAQDNAQPGALTRSFLVGNWGDSTGCRNPIRLSNDGSLHLNNARSGGWSLRGETLLLGISGLGEGTVRMTGADSIEVSLSGRRVLPLTRCPGGERGAELPLDGTRLTSGLMAGRWTEAAQEDNCDAAMTYLANGTVLTPPVVNRREISFDDPAATLGDEPNSRTSAGSTRRTGTWTLRGDNLRLSIEGRAALMQVVVVDRDHLLVHVNGSVGRLKRCS